MSTSTKVMGAALKRKEDPRLITGEAKYLDDVKLTGMVYAAILRSPYAHAKIKRINTESQKHPVWWRCFSEDFRIFRPFHAPGRQKRDGSRTTSTRRVLWRSTG
jgi:hypothetical protein